MTIEMTMTKENLKEPILDRRLLDCHIMLNALLLCWPSFQLKELVKKSLDSEIEKVLHGNNNDVERHYKHYIENSLSESKNILEKEDTEKLPERDAALIEKSQEYKEYNNTAEEREQQESQYEKSVEEHRRKKKKMVLD
jgi:hypothetical protein